MKRKRPQKFTPRDFLEDMAKSSPQHDEWQKRWLIPEDEIIEACHHTLRKNLSPELQNVNYELVVLVPHKDPNQRVYAAVMPEGSFSPISALDVSEMDLAPLVKEFRNSYLALMAHIKEYSRDQKNWMTAFNKAGGLAPPK